MSTQTIKELVRRELLAWNEGRIEVIDEIFAPTYVNHFTGETPAALKQKIAAVRVAFPDVQVAIDDQMVEGDRVVSRWTARGTQEGDFMGAPATHKRMEQTGISIMRVQESKIVEGWSRADDLGLLQQLVLIPATSIHENKAVIRRFVKEVLNDKNLAVIDEICPPDYVELDPLPGQGPGAAGLKQFLADSFFSAFPDLAWVNEEMVAEGEYVMARSTWTGTHRGEFLGIPPTHRTVKVAAWTIDHVVDGKFVDSRIMVDALGLLQQLGALTPWPPPAKTFQGMADEAYRAVPTLKAADLQRRLEKEPALLVIDVRDAAEVAQTGTIPGAINLSYGALTYLADHQAPEDWRDPRLADHARPIVTTCGLGPLGALGGKLLHDMGFTDVQILEGGVQAWIDAGLPMAKNGAR